MTLPYCGATGCRARAVVAWEAGDRNPWKDVPYRAAGACADPRHAVRVQAWVAQAGPVRVTAGDPDATWPDPDQDQLTLDLEAG